jgi:CelD/BcsL family acetyltransferase involved in cellulose biosynthesis
LRVTIADTEQDFRALREQWNALTNVAPGALFLQHEWFDAAWAWRKHNATLFVLLAWDGDRLAGIFPLISTHEKRGPVNIRRVELLTVPDTQFCDLLAAPGDRSAVSAAFSQELDRRRSHWDVLVLRYLGAEAAVLSDVAAALTARGYTSTVQTQDRNLFIPRSPWNAFRGPKRHRLKSKLL